MARKKKRRSVADSRSKKKRENRIPVLQKKKPGEVKFNHIREANKTDQPKQGGERRSVLHDEGSQGVLGGKKWEGRETGGQMPVSNGRKQFLEFFDFLKRIHNNKGPLPY